MRNLPVIYPSSFSATANLCSSDCMSPEKLSPEQIAELEAGRAYILAINLTRKKFNHPPLPADYRCKVALYSQTLMARDTALNWHKPPTGPSH